ncbi:MAG: ribosome-associated translation inhibitor RaiA [Candidatus Spechtbacterales bacterium]
MKINIKATNLELTDSIREYTERKIGELDKFVNITDDNDMEGGKAAVEAFVEVGRTTNRHRKGDDIYRAEVNITLPGEKHVLRAETEQHDLHIAIDTVKDEMQRVLKKAQGKRRTMSRKEGRIRKRISRLSRLARPKE